jgi:hypothetical protein
MVNTTTKNAFNAARICARNAAILSGSPRALRAVDSLISEISDRHIALGTEENMERLCESSTRRLWKMYESIQSGKYSKA